MNEQWYPNNAENYISEPSDAGDITIKQIMFFFAIGLIVAALSGVRSTTGPAYDIVRAILFVLLAVSLFLPVRWGIPLFVLLLLGGPDLVQAASEVSTEGEYKIASLWFTWIGPVTPSRFIMVCSIIQIIKIMNLAFDRRVKRVIVWFVTVPVVTGWVYGGFTSFARSAEVPNDVRFALLLITSIILFHSFLRKYPDSLGVILAVFIGALLGRHFCDVIYWLAGYGPRLAGAPRASVDSTKSTVVLLLLLSIYLIMGKKRMLLGTIIAMFSGLLVIIYGTRMIWISSVLCSVVLLYIFGARKSVIMVPLVLLLLSATWKIIQSVREESMLATSQKAEPFAYAVTGKEGNFLMRLEPLRYSEMVNSMSASMKRLSFLWGSGYGSYYRDEVLPFPASLINAFPEYSASTGQFYWCHNFLFQMLFKHGLVGMIIIWSLWLGPAWVCYKYVFDRKCRTMFNGILGCLIAFIPATIIHLYWTGKGAFVSGFVIAVLLAIYELHGVRAAELAPAYEGQLDLAQA